MDTALHIGSVLLGVGALYFGAEWLVRGSAGLALRFGVSPLVIGLTIVALGTSSPELFVCVALNLSGNPDTAVGNVVGSNICNFGLILGISALIRPLAIRGQLVVRDSPILIGATLLFIWMLHDGKLTTAEGVVLTVLILAYVFFSFRLAREEKDPEVIKEYEAEIGSPDAFGAGQGKPIKLSSLILAGIAVLVVGAKLLQDGSLAIAQQLGISDAIIGLSLVAVGTSLPELATSIVASSRNEGDIVTGNAVGSSIFNILAIMGVTILVRPMVISQIHIVDLAFMLGFAVLLLPMMWTRKKLSRIEGAALLLAYGIYIALLVQRGAVPAV